MKYYSESDLKEMIDYAIAYGTDITNYCPSLDDYPSIGIPDKHGRIVDLDKVLDWLINDKRAFSMAMSAKVDNALSDAPVILEASEYECPHYQGVCGLDESIICFSKSNRNCGIRLEVSE